jgi:hypothetical protein
MSNTIRIRTTPNGGDKYLKLKLDQKFDFIEILSLKISQEEAYKRFCSDYGVIAGRVIVNSGFGVPNAKVSVFIPIDDIDKEDSNIKNLYPYEVVTDRDLDGVRYNLLPKESENNNTCYTPVGTFPTKREILDNELMSHIYCKYYKFTTTTNYAGDFMIFGVPVGTHIVHVDADMSDIGLLSQRPYDLIAQGAPKKIFDSSTKFSKNTNLDKLTQVKTFNIGVNVQPFWGDLESCEVGITRLDIDLNYNLIPSAIFMGSIFGDQDKESVSKRCAPREELGELCQQITNEGTIEILRKTVDDTNELFFVEGGNVIDENGAWAFQVPMNLDYVVTDEQGNIVPSNDPSIGIPTRARVRFRIGMNDNGDLGRLRTRAKYLVPNNPQTQSDIDYSFDDSTFKESSFRDLFWNKIYSVTNFIPRYQKVKINVPNVINEYAASVDFIGGAAVEAFDRASTRNFTGIKNVDACSGDKTPFPYNRLNTKTNPLFRIICIIIKIIAFLVSVLNYVILPLINLLIGAINLVIGSIVDAINLIINGLDFLGLNITPIPWNDIGYIPCIVIECGDGQLFSPGCSSNFPTGLGFQAAVDLYGTNVNFCQSTICLGDTAGLDDCIAFQLATSLKLYGFDFYNDWINGTLYSYLVKYKRSLSGKEKFCEYDCDGNGGVDGNEDGVPDNNCHRQILLDTLYPDGNNSQNNNYETDVISEGLIKKNEDTLYYASSLRNASQKLFATDIICLGSVFECDWQGFPKINQYLIPSSYKIPPAISELGDEVDDVIETGMLELNSYGNTIQNGLFFSINCFGFNVNERQALNIRHICEMFVETDQAIEDEFGNVVQEADGVIGSNDIDGDIGKEFRDAFLLLNIGEQTPNSYSNEVINSNFNTNNFGVYDFTALVDNGVDYINFRGYPESNDDSFSQPKNSYFMYFGLVPGKTAVDILNQNYFAKCSTPVKKTFIIDSDSTADINNNGGGTITFTFINGFEPFTYTVTGPNGYSFTGTLGDDEITVVLTGLFQGNYTITATDSLGNPVSQNVFVSGPVPLFAFVEVTQNDTSLETQNGQITINSVVGGTAPYFFEVTDGLGGPAGSPSSGQITNLPLIINGLGANTTNGYTVLVTDSVGNSYETDGLIMSGVENLAVTADVVPTTCFNGTNGSIQLNISGGYTPYTTLTTGPNNFSSFASFLGALGVGTYVTNVIDAQGNSETITNVITSLNPQITIQASTPQDLLKQCDAQNHHVRFFVTSGLQPNSTAYISYQLDNGLFINISQPFVSGSVPLEMVIPNNLFALNVKIKVSNTSNYECFSNLITINKPSIATPISNLAITGTKTNIAGPNWEYDIDATGGILPYSSIVIRDLADNLIYNSGTNPQYLVSSVNNANGTSYIFQMPFNGIKVNIIDNVGCEIEQTIN